MAARHPTVLVVDDSADLRENLEELLAGGGYEVALAPSADAALRFLASAPGRPDAVLLDLFMPGMTAADFVAKVRATPAWAGLKILLMTAATERDIPPDLRIDGVVPKPFRFEQLLSALEAVGVGRPAPRRG